MSRRWSGRSRGSGRSRPRPICGRPPLRVALSWLNRNKKTKPIPWPFGQVWMIRRFTSARLFPHQRVQRIRTLWVQAITAPRALHCDFSIATDFPAEIVKSQAIRGYTDASSRPPGESRCRLSCVYGAIPTLVATTTTPRPLTSARTSATLPAALDRPAIMGETRHDSWLHRRGQHGWPDVPEHHPQHQPCCCLSFTRGPMATIPRAASSAR